MSKKTVGKQPSQATRYPKQEEKPKTEKKDLIFAVGAIVIAVVMAVISWMILPASVATQFQGMSTGAPNVPKLVAVALPLVITVVFAVQSLKNHDSLKVCLVGYAANILFWLSNM